MKDTGEKNLRVAVNPDGVCNYVKSLPHALSADIFRCINAHSIFNHGVVLPSFQPFRSTKDRNRGCTCVCYKRMNT